MALNLHNYYASANAVEFFKARPSIYESALTRVYSASRRRRISPFRQTTWIYVLAAELFNGPFAVGVRHSTCASAEQTRPLQSRRLFPAGLWTETVQAGVWRCARFSLWFTLQLEWNSSPIPRQCTVMARVPDGCGPVRSRGSRNLTRMRGRKFYLEWRMGWSKVLFAKVALQLRLRLVSMVAMVGDALVM